MASKVENQEQLLLTEKVPTNRRYIFFDNPPELWIGDEKTENHTKVLAASRRKLEDIAVCGYISRLTPLRAIKIEGSGSSNLEFPTKGAEPAVSFLKALPANEAVLIEAW